MEMDRVQTDGALGNEAGKRDKNGEEHQSKRGLGWVKTGKERVPRQKYVKLKKMRDNYRKLGIVAKGD